MNPRLELLIDELRAAMLAEIEAGTSPLCKVMQRGTPQVSKKLHASEQAGVTIRVVSQRAAPVWLVRSVDAAGNNFIDVQIDAVDQGAQAEFAAGLYGEFDEARAGEFCPVDGRTRADVAIGDDLAGLEVGAAHARAPRVTRCAADA